MWTREGREFITEKRLREKILRIPVNPFFPPRKKGKMEFFGKGTKKILQKCKIYCLSLLTIT
jgi:hypothetical protein